MNPLYYAVQSKDLRETTRLISIGCDVNKKLPGGWTPLHAATVGPVEILKLLLYHDADTGAVNDLGKTPLHIACKYNKFHAAAILIDKDNTILKRYGIPELMNELSFSLDTPRKTRLRTLLLLNKPHFQEDVNTKLIMGKVYEMEKELHTYLLYFPLDIANLILSYVPVPFYKLIDEYMYIPRTAFNIETRCEWDSSANSAMFTTSSIRKRRKRFLK